jgi:antitoxin YefM
MQRVCDDHEQVVITRKNAESVVMMSLEDFNSWLETIYLLRNPANAARLRESMAQIERGDFAKRDLLK